MPDPELILLQQIQKSLEHARRRPPYSIRPEIIKIYRARLPFTSPLLSMINRLVSETLERSENNFGDLARLQLHHPYTILE